jgi:membrane dipeptidase
MQGTRCIDLHCDTLTDWIDRGDELGLFDLPDKMLDLKRLHTAGAMAECFAVFFPPQEENARGLTDDEIFTTSRRILHQAAEQHSDIFALAGNAADIRANYAAGKISGLLTIEDGRAVNGQLERLDYFYQQGVRCMALVWNFGSLNHGNCFGVPNSPEQQNVGLTPFGRNAVAYMQQLGMLVDVSHLSDGGFWDVVDCTDKPFVASHSNCRSVCPLLRNLSDDMIRALADRGGVSGVNFCPDLTKLGATHTTAEDLAEQVLHFVNVGGEDCVALGTDFDGMGGTIEVSDPTKIPLLFDALQRRGMTPRQLDKLAFGNAMRVLEDAMK